jgi:hypothetical protein
MTEKELVTTFVTALVKALTTTPDEGWNVPAQPPEKAEPAAPQPRFDFVPESDAQYGGDDALCEHGGSFFDRASCPVHGPSAQETPTAQELDDIVSEAEPAPISRARRLAEQKARQARSERLWPEDLDMKGMGPPPDLP